MATLSETMTLAGFSARVTAGTLNIGQIYNISDKGWVLQAHTNVSAKTLNGALKINNGDTLPAGIVPDYIVIDTGIITSDISIDTGTPLIITLINGYHLIATFVEAITQNDVLSGVVVCGDFSLNNDYSAGEKQKNTYINMKFSALNNIISANNNGGGNTMRVVMDFAKIP